MAKKEMRVVANSGEKKLGEHLEDLYVALSKDELLNRGQELARVEEEQRKLDQELEIVKAGFKRRQGELDTKRATLSAVIRDKRELRPVKVESWARYDRQLFQEVRSDTCEIINERALEPDEMQIEFPLLTPDQLMEHR